MTMNMNGVYDCPIRGLLDPPQMLTLVYSYKVSKKISAALPTTYGPTLV